MERCSCASNQFYRHRHPCPAVLLWYVPAPSRTYQQLGCFESLHRQMTHGKREGRCLFLQAGLDTRLHSPLICFEQCVNFGSAFDFAPPTLQGSGSLLGVIRHYVRHNGAACRELFVLFFGKNTRTHIYTPPAFKYTIATKALDETAFLKSQFEAPFNFTNVA